MTASRRTSDALTGLDTAAAGFLGLAALLFLPIVITGNAGPFGSGALPSFLLVVIGAPLALVAAVMRLFWRRSHNRSGTALVAAMLAVVAVIGGLPLRDAIQQSRETREAESIAASIDVLVRDCAEHVTAGEPAETHLNRESFDELRNEATECVEAVTVRGFDLQCLTYGCSSRPPLPPHDLVREYPRYRASFNLDAYLVEALTKAGFTGSIDRSPYDQLGPLPKATVDVEWPYGGD